MGMEQYSASPDMEHLSDVKRKYRSIQSEGRRR